MWYTWTVLLLVSRVVSAQTARPAPATTPLPAPVATTARPPPRTLDRQAAELVWRTWLQESGNQNAPPRRITTKSLFVTPYVCPKGHRLDQQGCVQVVSVPKDEHERTFLDELNKLFTASPDNGEINYDYGDELSGPVQVSIPIGLDPQASPLQADTSVEAQNYVKVDKKDNNTNPDISLEAELELLKLQNIQNDKAIADQHTALNNNYLPYPDKPKRDSPVLSETEEVTLNVTADEGQKEEVYGHVNVDPLYTDYQNQATDIPTTAEVETIKPDELTSNIILNNDAINVNNTIIINNNITTNNATVNNETKVVNETDTSQQLSENGPTKLNPENEYANIGDTIKLISRYAEVTTDDNFSKDQERLVQDDSILGTREKPQHRRKPLNKDQDPKLSEINNKGVVPHNSYPKVDFYYRYPWSSDNAPTPPPNYPFKNLQDYWPGQNRYGGIYNTAHENPTRHHHSYLHNYFRPRGYGNPYSGYHQYPVPQPSPRRRLQPRHANFVRSRSTDQDLYSLLGLRHWFSGEGTSNR